jgi:hypothetical protein
LVLWSRGISAQYNYLFCPDATAYAYHHHIHSDSGARCSCESTQQPGEMSQRVQD